MGNLETSIKELISSYTSTCHDLDDLIPFNSNPSEIIAKIDTYRRVIDDLTKVLCKENEYD